MLKEDTSTLTFGNPKLELGQLKERLKMEENGNVVIYSMSLTEPIMKLSTQFGSEEFPPLKNN